MEWNSGNDSDHMIHMITPFLLLLFVSVFVYFAVGMMVVVSKCSGIGTASGSGTSSNRTRRSRRKGKIKPGVILAGCSTAGG